MVVGWGIWGNPEIKKAIFKIQFVHIKSPLPCRFSVHFSLLLSAFVGEQLFASKSKKLAQNPFCKRAPLMSYKWSLCFSQV